MFLMCLDRQEVWSLHSCCSLVFLEHYSTEFTEQLFFVIFTDFSLKKVPMEQFGFI